MRGWVGQSQLDRGGEVCRQVARHGGDEDPRRGLLIPPDQKPQKQPRDPRSHDAERKQIGSERGQSAVREQQGLEHQRDQSQRGHGLRSKQIRSHGHSRRMRGTAGDGGHAQRTQGEQERRGSRQQHAILAFGLHLFGDRAHTEHGRGKRRHAPADAVRNRQESLGDMHATLWFLVLGSRQTRQQTRRVADEQQLGRNVNEGREYGVEHDPWRPAVLPRHRRSRCRRNWRR